MRTGRQVNDFGVSEAHKGEEVGEKFESDLQEINGAVALTCNMSQAMKMLYKLLTTFPDIIRAQVQ